MESYLDKLEKNRNLLLEDNLEIKHKKVSLQQIEEYFTKELSNIEYCRDRNLIGEKDYIRYKDTILDIENGLFKYFGYDRESILNSEN